MPHAGGGRSPADGGVDAGLRDGPAVVGEHQLSGLAGSLGEPLAEQCLHGGVERDVAVGVQLADGDVEPFAVTDPHDRVGGHAEELALAQPGAGQDLDGYPVEQGWQLAGGGQQSNGAGVVRQPGQRIEPAPAEVLSWPVALVDHIAECVPVKGRCVRRHECRCARAGPRR
jgi:hypothetical protein